MIKAEVVFDGCDIIINSYTIHFDSCGEVWDILEMGYLVTCKKTIEQAIKYCMETRK